MLFSGRLVGLGFLGRGLFLFVWCGFVFIISIKTENNKFFCGGENFHNSLEMLDTCDEDNNN